MSFFFGEAAQEHPVEQGSPVLAGWAQLVHPGQHVGGLLPMETGHLQQFVDPLVAVQLVYLQQPLLHLLVDVCWYR
jgi:hypothetical protein